MSKLSHYIKLRSSLSGCNAKQFECDKYLDCDSCLEDKIKEHDKQIRADAIDDFKNNLIKLIKLREESHFYDISEHEYEWLIADIMYSAKKLKE